MSEQANVTLKIYMYACNVHLCTAFLMQSVDNQGKRSSNMALQRKCHCDTAIERTRNHTDLVS